MTSKARIIEILKTQGRVDNYYCIDNRITTRLGAYICQLKKEGWNFSKKMEDKNCVYTVVKEKSILELSEIGKKNLQEALFTYKNPHPITRIHNDPA